MAWEFDVLHALQTIHNPVLDALFSGITHLGDGGVFWILLTAGILIFVKDKRVAATAILALLLDVLLCNLLLKPLVARDRPFWLDESVQLIVKAPKDYSFPSGHSAASFAASISYVQYNRKWGIAAILLAACIAFSRLYLFVHFPTDVLAGICIGCICGVVSGMIVRRCFMKWEQKNG